MEAARGNAAPDHSISSGWIAPFSSSAVPQTLWDA